MATAQSSLLTTKTRKFAVIFLSTLGAEQELHVAYLLHLLARHLVCMFVPLAIMSILVTVMVAVEARLLAIEVKNLATESSFLIQYNPSLRSRLGWTR